MLQDFFAQSCADEIDFINPLSQHPLNKGLLEAYDPRWQGGNTLRALLGKFPATLSSPALWSKKLATNISGGSLGFVRANSTLLSIAMGANNIKSNNAFTLAMWVTQDIPADTSANTNRNIMSSTANSNSISYHDRSGFLPSLSFNVRSGLGGPGISSNNTLPPFLPFHLICVYQSSDQRMYVNGVLVASSTASFTLPSEQTDFSFGSGWDGSIDGLRIYDRALADPECKKLASIGRELYNWIPSSIGVLPAVAGGTTTTTTTTTTAAPTTYHLTAAINSAIVVGPNNLSNTRHITANAQAAVAIGPSELLNTRHFTSIIAADVAIGPNNLSNTRHFTCNIAADVAIGPNDLTNTRHFTASIPAEVLFGNVDLRNTISFVASFAANVTIGPSNAINTRHLTASVQSEVVIGTCELFVTRHLTGLAQAIASFASVDLLVTRPFTTSINAEILFGNVNLHTDGQVYSNNPYVLLHNAIWDLFESDSNFTNMFKVKNRIKFNSATNRDPRKERIQSADAPEIELVYDAEVINLTESNTGASLLVTYALMIESGDYRINEYINAIHWIMLCNLVQWRSALTAITWKDKHPVKRINVVDVSHGESGTNRLQGFDSIWRCQIEMHFPVVDLVFN